MNIVSSTKYQVKGLGMHDFKELKVWQKSMDLAIDIYKASSGFPEEEKYGLVSQMRRCSVSIASNIAEGAGRNSKKEFVKFLSISLGSCFEMETQLIITSKLNYMEREIAEKLLDKLSEIQKMIYSLQKSMQ